MPWHYCPEEVFTLPQIWSGSGAGFRKLLKGLPRPHPDPQLEWHLQLFDQYTRLKHGLERRRRVALLSDQDLRKLRIVRGAPLDIDDIRPIDVEKRFFLPAHPKWVKWFAKQFFKRKERWPTPAPEECWEEDADGNRVTNIHHVNHYCAALARMTEWYDQSRGIWFANPWWTMRGIGDIDPTLAASYGKFRIGPANQYHEYIKRASFVFRNREANNASPPHMMIATCDTMEPDDRILRSELLLAVNTLRGNLAAHPWLQNHTFPLLVLSFHATGARILQMHAEDNRLILRVSRRLVFPTKDGSIPHDGLLMLSWLLSKPIGDTRFSAVPSRATPKDMQSFRDEEDSKQNLEIPTVSTPDFTTMPECLAGF